MNSYILTNALSIPKIGFGTWQIQGEDCYNAVLGALEAGYTHIDTAVAYQNEEEVGKAIKDSNINRENLFLTTKLWNKTRGYEETKVSFFESLERLQTDYLDLYLIHWPNPIDFRDNWQEMNAQSYRAMEDLYLDKKIKAIGVSNFDIRHLKELFKTARIKPMVNQIKLCPGLAQAELVAFCREHDILLEAYSPLGSGAVLKNTTLQQLANKYQRSIAQVCIRYSLQKNYLPLPKSANLTRLQENLAVDDFIISSEDMLILDNLATNCPQHNPDLTNF